MYIVLELLCSAAFAGSYTDNGNGTITDNITTLMWQKQDDGTGRTWEQAISYCESLSLGGYADWRLPNIKELRSIIDLTKYDPAINSTYFPNTQSAFYWSSTTFADYNTSAFNVDFYSGNSSDIINKTLSHAVRCVR